MGALADIDQYEVRANTLRLTKWCCVVPIGGAGATGTLLQQPPGMTVTNTGTGTFDVAAMPVAQALSTGKSRPYFTLYSPANTVKECIMTASDFNAGTMSIITSKAGTAANPASGDYILINFEGEPE